ncbi:unnamed protein product [Prorocentrum cordatum]|uniref:Calmodulin-lysine N-methyltransferase n=1 Tax=Prorocentrum cordatum TaxID=2364126 RepID=A0ABN9WXM8_9DINO|nr:unnamed protein product [Polarella glacialis]
MMAWNACANQRRTTGITCATAWTGLGIVCSMAGSVRSFVSRSRPSRASQLPYVVKPLRGDQRFQRGRSWQAVQARAARVPALPSGRRLQIAEGVEGSDVLGSRVWPCAASMCSWLREHAVQVESSNVLEVGSGTGVVGLFAAALGAAHVTLSDGGPQSLERLARHNVAVNQEAGLIPASADVRVVSFQWGESAPRLGGGRAWDWVLGSDVTYSRGSHAMLCDALAALLSECGGRAPPRVLVAHEHRGLVTDLTRPRVDGQLEHFQQAAFERRLSVRVLRSETLGEHAIGSPKVSLLEVQQLEANTAQ